MMKPALLIAATAALASAQYTIGSDGTITCPADKPNGNFCAGGSLSTNIIIRCNAGKGQAGNCNDNLSGYPGGYDNALCYESSTVAGDGACEKACIVHNESGPFYTLPGCTTGISSSATPTSTSTSTAIVGTGSSSYSNATVTTTILTSTTTSCSTSSVVTTTPPPFSSNSTITTSYSASSIITSSAGSSGSGSGSGSAGSGGPGSGGSGSSSGGSGSGGSGSGSTVTPGSPVSSATNTPITPPLTTTSSPTQFNGGASSFQSWGAMLVAGMAVAYFL